MEIKESVPQTKDALILCVVEDWISDDHHRSCGYLRCWNLREIRWLRKCCEKVCWKRSV